MKHVAKHQHGVRRGVGIVHQHYRAVTVCDIKGDRIVHVSPGSAVHVAAFYVPVVVAESPAGHLLDYLIPGLGVEIIYAAAGEPEDLGLYPGCVVDYIPCLVEIVKIRLH